jgi:DNA-binding XRE family transcriptional regulator
VVKSDIGSRAEAPPGFRGQPLPLGVDQPLSEIDFLAQLGGRVREMRTLRDMSRRELSRKSGISERYIAQIEAGKGNVSIMLLLRIAHAIRCG